MRRAAWAFGMSLGAFKTWLGIVGLLASLLFWVWSVSS